MNSVSIIPGILVASVAGLAFYFIVSEPIKRMLSYVFTSNIFFFLGQIISQKAGWTYLRLGSFNLLPALAASLLGMLLFRYLAGPTRLHNRGKSQ